MLKEFFRQQQRMEMQWREMMERRAHEQQLFEQEWRESMEKIERERLMIEQNWREREEQRRIREESRAERRDALLTTLLSKLVHENDIDGLVQRNSCVAVKLEKLYVLMFTALGTCT
ncbi:hypothetical protein GH714_041081 [Hevea brasiliensis]|uniref:Uncharacterized protein n=1 Tax=Hevea brasiliensis TaxID=3981 RepID=A0A6A6MUY7_HEVBR|nr:hypothetical protein GH714_041081 [Hevea brasiliensis]